MEQHRGKPSCFLNNVRHGDFDPFETTVHAYASWAPDCADPERLRSERKQLLVYSYEDDLRQLQEEKDIAESVYDESFFDNRTRYLGNSRHFFDVIILRDPFNFFASRYKKLDVLTGVKDLDQVRVFWKSLARTAIDWEASGDDTHLVINYNRWFMEKKYRRQLSKRLFGRFSDASLMSVAGAGGGSSFDAMEYDRLTWAIIRSKWRLLFDFERYLHIKGYLRRLFRKGSQGMKVLERWEQMRSEPAFRKIFADREVLELSEQIFGRIPGTRAFVEECIKDG